MKSKEKKKIDKSTKLNLLLYISALLQMLYDAIEECEGTDLFQYKLANLARNMRREAERVMKDLYFGGGEAIPEEAENQFYNFKELLEREIELMMYANKEEKEEIINILAKIEKRICCK